MKKFLLPFIILAILATIAEEGYAINSKQKAVTYTHKGEWVIKTNTNFNDTEYSLVEIYKGGVPIYDSLSVVASRGGKPVSWRLHDFANIESYNAVARIVNQTLTQKERQSFINRPDWQWQVQIMLTIDAQTHRICEIAFWVPFTDKPFERVSHKTMKKLHKRLMGLTFYGEGKEPYEYFIADFDLNEHLVEGKQLTERVILRD